MSFSCNCFIWIWHWPFLKVKVLDVFLKVKVLDVFLKVKVLDVFLRGQGIRRFEWDWTLTLSKGQGIRRLSKGQGRGIRRFEWDWTLYAGSSWNMVRSVEVEQTLKSTDITVDIVIVILLSLAALIFLFITQSHKVLTDDTSSMYSCSWWFIIYKLTKEHCNFCHMSFASPGHNDSS